MKNIYLDYNASTPPDPSVVQAMLPYLQQFFGNPSSRHAYGASTGSAVENARQQVAQMLGCASEEIVFTSGGTESNNHAIKGVAAANRSKGNHIVTSAVEHPSITEVCRELEAAGFEVAYVDVDVDGLVDPERIAAAITPRTILVSIMHANNEVGSIQPLREIAELAHRCDVVVHADCAQSVGKIPVRVDELGVDLISLAGHKMYAPIGVGALYIRRGVRVLPFMHGGGHESGRRAGTENYVGIVGLGEASRLVHENVSDYRDHLATLRDRLEEGLRRRCGDIRVNGHPARRLPNTASVGFRDLVATEILAALPDVAMSAGSACHTDGVEVSKVLQAMHVPPEYAQGTIRFSVGRFTTAEEIDRAVESIGGVTDSLRSHLTHR